MSDEQQWALVCAERDEWRARAEAAEAIVSEARKQERIAWAMLTDPKCMQGQPVKVIAAVAQAACVYLQDYERALGPCNVRRAEELRERAERAEQERDEARGEVGRVREALREALDGWVDSTQYKGEYLCERHGDLERIQELREALGCGGGT